MILRVCVLVLAWIGLSPAPSRAQEDRAPVSLSLATCPGFAPERVRNIVSAELGALLVGEGETPASDTTAVTVTCGESILLRVVDPVTGKTLERRIEESSLHPLARDRFLALAIVELVAASWIELEVTPEPAVVPADRTASDATRERAREAASEATAPAPAEVRLALFGAVSVVGSPVRASFGGGVRLDHEPDALLGWSLSLSGEHAEVLTELGSVAVDQLGGQLEATMRARVGLAWIQGALGVRATAVIMTGGAASSDIFASTFVAPALGPHGALRVWLEPAAGFYVGLGAAFSWTLLAAHGLVEGRRAVSVDGPALIGDLLVGLRVD